MKETLTKIRSRTWWLVFFMFGATVYLANNHDWPWYAAAIIWTILIAGWFGGKAWASLIDAAKEVLCAWKGKRP